MGAEPIRPRALWYHRPDVPRLILCRAAEARERWRVLAAVTEALAAVGYELVPSRRVGPAGRGAPRIRLGRRTFYLRRTGGGMDDAARCPRDGYRGDASGAV
jgi:hypothetical protein